jgi:hypothetical protein
MQLTRISFNAFPLYLLLSVMVVGYKLNCGEINQSLLALSTIEP